jgi:CheY-like chemotaxis protein
MVYGMAQRHSGELGIESTPGQGTLVRLTFPASAGAGSPIAPAASADLRPLARLRILIIDDDPILLRSLRDVLEGDGHQVTAAPNGIAGVDAFTTERQDGAGFDAVITDLGMPGMDGRRVAAAIKLHAPETPILLLTGWGERLRAEEEVIPHIDCILSKPPKLREVRTALAQWCGTEAQRKAAGG